MKKRFTFAGLFLFILLLGIWFADFTAEAPSSEPEAAEGAVVIPAMNLPKNSSASMDMVGLVVYRGKIYTQTSSRIAPEAAAAIVGEQLGRTKASLDEWSRQEEFEEEWASTIGQQNIYAVKGYDPDFRIMTYQEVDGTVWTEFYECLNGIAVSSGADLISKLRVKDNVQSARSESFESWNQSLDQTKGVILDDTVSDFIRNLYEAKPIEYRSMIDQGIYEKSGDTRKFLTLTLTDRTEIRLDLHLGGYVRYAPADVFFKMDDDAFTAMWQRM